LRVYKYIIQVML